jgi:hypothetical protein
MAAFSLFVYCTSVSCGQSHSCLFWRREVEALNFLTPDPEPDSREKGQKLEPALARMRCARKPRVRPPVEPWKEQKLNHGKAKMALSRNSRLRAGIGDSDGWYSHTFRSGKALPAAAKTPLLLNQSATVEQLALGTTVAH